MPRRTPAKCQLLFGPYTPPNLKVGDRAVCLFRDTDVIITSWTDAPIPWPRFRAVDKPHGGSGLLVDEELARAVRSESKAAVMYWCGASHAAVYNWRKALGVGQWEPEGSRRLHRVNSAKVAAAFQAHEFTEAERRQRRQTALRNNLARHLQPGYNGPAYTEGWTAADLALLGTMPDAELAERIGRPYWSVFYARRGRGIPAFTGPRRRRKRP